MKKFIFLLLLPVFSVAQNLQWQWAKNVNSAMTNGSHLLCKGDHGSFYLATSYNAQSEIKKFDLNGNGSWSIIIAGNAYMTSITPNQNNFYIAGNFTNSLSIGNTTLQSVGSTDIFL